MVIGLMRRWVGFVLCAVCVAGAWACRGNADFSDAMPAPVTLSAEEYRPEITEIDRLVFAEGPFDETRRDSLAGKLDRLARRMKTSSDSRFIAIEALEVRRLARVAKRAPAKPPPSMLSDQWMRIRSNVFDDRSWFARRAADLEPAPGLAVAASTAVPSAPRATLTPGISAPVWISHTLPDPTRVHDRCAKRVPIGNPVAEAQLRSNGTVGDVRIIRSTGCPAADKLLQDTLKTWTFKPALESGKAVDTSLTITINHFWW